MTNLVRPVIACDNCDAVIEPAAKDVIIGTRGIHPSQAEAVEFFRDRLPRGWASWVGQDGKTYDACPSCAPTKAW